MCSSPSRDSAGVTLGVSAAVCLCWEVVDVPILPQEAVSDTHHCSSRPLRCDWAGRLVPPGGHWLGVSVVLYLLFP